MHVSSEWKVNEIALPNQDFWDLEVGCNHCHWSPKWKYSSELFENKIDFCVFGVKMVSKNCWRFGSDWKNRTCIMIPMYFLTRNWIDRVPNRSRASWTEKWLFFTNEPLLASDGPSEAILSFWWPIRSHFEILMAYPKLLLASDGTPKAISSF